MKIKDSIRRRLIISLVLLAIIPLFLLGTLLSWQSFVIQQRQVIELQREKARRILNQIGSIIHEQEEVLSNALTIDYYVLDLESERQRRFLSQLLSFSVEGNVSIFNEIALLNGRGQEVARESRTSIITPRDLRDRSNADEFTVPVASRQSYYGPVRIDDKTGAPFMLVSLPIIDSRSNNVKGVLAAEMRMKFMWDIVDKINAGEAGLVYIVDTTGRVIVHPNPSVVLKGTYFDAHHKSGIGTGLDGTKVVLTQDKLDLGNRHLHIVTELPLDEALKSTYTSLLTIAVFLVLTLTGSVAFGIVIVRQIIRPVESLAETAQAISAGDIDRKAVIIRNDELGALSESFNIMTSRLAETIASFKSQMTEREKAESALSESHERLLLVLDSIEAIVYVSDMKTYELLFLNKYARDIFGDTTGKVCWQTLQTGQAGPCAFCSNDKLLGPEGNPKGTYKWEFQNTLNNRWYYIHDRAIQWVDGRIVRFEIATDITDRKAAEEKVTTSLREKEVLIKEIHHRVKNNMQVISSLLNLQARQLSDKKYIELFHESRNRITSMALVHEKLYNSKDLANVDFKDYINSLVNGLFTFYGASANKVLLNMSVENINLSIDTAIPCGLIVNELVSNSLKYAFPEEKKGELKIVLDKSGPDDNGPVYSLLISDNGIGIPKGLNIRKTNTLGLQLVTNLVEHQLQGSLQLDRSGGTSFTIRFRELRYKNRL